MIGLSTRELGRRFSRQWVFRGLNVELTPGASLGIRGPNGSGKSTLMRVLAGQLTSTEGTLAWSDGATGKPLAAEHLYRHLCWNGPYLDVYGELTLQEALRLHFRFKRPLLPGTTLVEQTDATIRAIDLWPHRHKELRQYSSGMAQRAKLGMALLSQGGLLLLDEPTSFMDTHNAQFALELIRTHSAGRTLVLASNLERELELVPEVLELEIPVRK